MSMNAAGAVGSNYLDLSYENIRLTISSETPFPPDGYGHLQRLVYEAHRLDILMRHGGNEPASLPQDEGADQ